MRATFFLALCLLASACSNNPTVQSSADAANSADALGAGDVTAADVPAIAVCSGPGGKPYVETAAADPTRKKFALSLFHFNVEYVIGGLEWTDADGTKHAFLDKAINAGWDDAKVEDYIVQETFLPILQLYDAHPSWGVNLELQAYMIDVMAKRHPQTLDLLRKLAQRGQAELVSFHYTDQLFLAFAKEDLHRSIQRVREVFTANCLPLSGVVFNQEGQAGEGRQQMLLAEGYTIGVFPKNLWRYVHKDVDKQGFWPLYSSEGGDLIAGPGGIDAASGIDVAWNFLDDGELRAAPKTSVGPLNPYFAAEAPHDPVRVEEFAKELADTEKQGFYMARISDYVRHLKAAKFQAKPAPPLLDGTWQAPSTSSIHRWLGGRGNVDPIFKVEQDNAVRSGNALASLKVRALQRIVDALKAKSRAPSGIDAQMTELWTLLFRAEVSDCSGVNPWYGEVQFGLTTNAKIHERIAAIMAQVHKNSVGPWRVDLATGSAQVHDKRSPPPGGLEIEPSTGPADPPLAVTVTTTDRPVQSTWSAVGQDRWRLAVHIGKSPCTDCDTDVRQVTVKWPRKVDALEYSPALIEDAVRTYPLAAFQFSSDEAWLPLANGLLGLGEGWYVIKHVTKVHIAARVAPASPTFDFVDQTVPYDTEVDWVFEVFHGKQSDALAIANRLNLQPVVWF